MNWLHGKKGRSNAPFHNYFGSKGLGLQAKFDPHLIAPGVTWHEEKQLEGIRGYVEKQTGSECTLPQHCIEDVYSTYVNKDVKRKPRNEKNELKQVLLDKTYNSLSKILTTNSPLFSQILTKELAVYMQEVQDQLEEEEQNGGEGMENPFDQDDGEGEGSQKGEGEGSEGESKGDADGDGEGNGDEQKYPGAPTKDSGTSSRTPKDILEDIMDKSKDKLDKAVDKAEKKMNELKDQLGEDALEDLSKNDPEFLDKAERLRGELNKLSLNRENIHDVLKNILSKSSVYFSKKYTHVEESIFEADELNDMVGLELLHPIFKKTKIMDVINRTKKYEGKIDLYLDCSGSMSSIETFGDKRISLADITKGIAITLYRMGMIDKLYFFDGSLYEIKVINELTILSFSRSGGTNFDNVIRQVEINKRNSIIVTDGEDSISKYVNNVFWVGVGGTRFSSGYSGGFKPYRDNKQCVTFNSNTQVFEKIV